MTEAGKQGGGRVFLIVAVLLGVLASVLAFVLLESRDKEDRTPKVDVYVARTTLRPQQLINVEKDLKLMRVPKSPELDALLAAVFTPANPPPANQRVNRMIPSGTFLLATDLGGYSDFELRHPMRAMSIPCKGANALSGLLVPGEDHVKLFVTRPVINAMALAPTTATGAPGEVITDATPKIGPGGREGASVYRSYQLLGGSAVRVLAVNSRLARQRKQLTEAAAYEAVKESENQQTVTLEVTEAQAKEILEQTAGGLYQVTLILCPPEPKAATAPAN